MMRLGSFVGIAMLLTGVGCAHRRNDYAYAPPYAPPVYPQPPSVTQPVSYAQPAGAVPEAVVPAGAMPAGTIVPGPVVASQTSPCPQDCAEGTVVGTPVVMEGGGQTPPCPPGP